MKTAQIRGVSLGIVLLLCLASVLLPAAGAGWQGYPALGATSGGLFSFVRGEESLILGSEGAVSDFKGLSIGGHVLAAELYTVAGDSCAITVSGGYLSAFEPGEYAVRILFSDGETLARLSITDPAAAAEKAADTAPEAPAPAEPPMLEGGAEAADTAAMQINPSFTGVSKLMIGLLMLGGGGAVLFGLGRRWMAAE